MAINLRYTHVWHVAETGTPFCLQMNDSYGAARSDILSATFTLVNRDTNDKLIDAAACQSVADGLLAYRPTAGQMATPCRFLAQFTATTTLAQVLPTVYVEGEIEDNL